jgi:DNA-binding LytR/AlgR family response regulator
MMLHLKQSDPYAHRIESASIGIPKSSILYLEDVRYAGLENNYTRIHFVNGKSIVVSDSLSQIEAQMNAHDSK